MLRSKPGGVHEGEKVWVASKKINRRQQNRESATRTRQRKETYIQKLERQMQQLVKENQDLKIVNASLTTENDLLRKQVSYFQGLVTIAAEPKPQEEVICDLGKDELPLDLPPKDDLFHCEDSDYEFFGPTSPRESPVTPTFFTTILFGMIWIVSLFVGSASKSGQSVDAQSGFGLKTVSSRSMGSTVLGWVLDPYTMFVGYMTGILLSILYTERAWAKRKMKKIIARLRGHSKTS